jgi:DMSO reductase anchor subunit
MDAVLIALVASVALFVISVLSVGLPPAKRHYEEHYRKIDDRKLVEANVTARMMRKRLQIFTWVIPIPLALVLTIVRDQSLTTGLLCIMILSIFSGQSARHVFWQIERITASELEYRKFKKADG